MKRLWLLVTWCWLFAIGHAQEVHIARYWGDRQAAVTFTFDDGLLEHYTEVFPRLKALRLKASFGIIGSKVGGDHKGTPCMSWQQLREMAADGQEITSHGWQHRSMENLSGESLRYEVQHNDTVIYDNVGTFPRTYFYPGNRKTDEGVAFTMCDRVGARMTQLSFGSKRDSLWVQQILKRTIGKGEWTILMTHGITRGYDAFADPQLLWHCLEQAAALQDRLWVTTLHDALAYIAERDSVQLAVKLSDKRLSVVPTCNLNKELFTLPLTMIVDADVKEVRQDGQTLPLIRKGNKTMFDFNPNGGQIDMILKNNKHEKQTLNYAGSTAVAYYG